MTIANDEFYCGRAQINCVTKNNTSGNRTFLVQKRVSFYASFITICLTINSEFFWLFALGEPLSWTVIVLVFHLDTFLRWNKYIWLPEQKINYVLEIIYERLSIKQIERKWESVKGLNDDVKELFDIFLITKYNRY